MPQKTNCVRLFSPCHKQCMRSDWILDRLDTPASKRKKGVEGVWKVLMVQMKNIHRLDVGRKGFRVVETREE